MKKNYSVVPLLFGKNLALSAKMSWGFIKMGKSRLLPKRTYNYNHMRNLCLVYFKLTPLCNLRCKMCGQWGDRGIMKTIDTAAEAHKILPLRRYMELVDEIAPRRPVCYIWGGEPFLYPDLMPLAKYMVDKGLFVSVNTNGTLVEQRAEQIVRDKWSTIFVSLDAFRETNDAMRGKGSYDRVVSGFKAINREKEKRHSVYPIIAIVTTVTNRNYLDLSRLAEAAREFRLDLHIFNLGTYTNNAIINAQRQVMKEQLDTSVNCLAGYCTGYNDGIDGKQLYAILKDLHARDYGHPIITVPALNPEKTHAYYTDLETPVRNHCIVPWCQANINYNGDVHFCADYPDYLLGNIEGQSFTEIYNGERANRFRAAIRAREGGIFPGCLRCYQNMLFGKNIRGY